VYCATAFPTNKINSCCETKFGLTVKVAGDNLRNPRTVHSILRPLGPTLARVIQHLLRVTTLVYTCILPTIRLVYLRELLYRQFRIYVIGRVNSGTPSPGGDRSYDQSTSGFIEKWQKLRISENLIVIKLLLFS